MSIPVVGNGDINSAASGVLMLKETGCDAVMVGRAALKNPFIFSQIEALLKNNKNIAASNDDLFGAMEKLVKYYSEYYDDQHAARMLRGRLVWFVRGVPGVSRFRKQLSQLKSCSEAYELIQIFSDSLDQQGYSAFL